MPHIGTASASHWPRPAVPTLLHEGYCRRTLAPAPPSSRNARKGKRARLAKSSQRHYGEDRRLQSECSNFLVHIDDSQGFAKRGEGSQNCV